jgi:hypothetical protein
MPDEIHIGVLQKRLVGTKCPHCGRPCDGGACVSDQETARAPKPGDFGVCCYCGSINCYTDTLALRRIERAEQRALKRDPRMSKLLEILLDASRRYRRGIQ